MSGSLMKRSILYYDVLRAPRQVLDQVVLWKGVLCDEPGGGSPGSHRALRWYVGRSEMAKT